MVLPVWWLLPLSPSTASSCSEFHELAEEEGGTSGTAKQQLSPHSREARSAAGTGPRHLTAQVGLSQGPSGEWAPLVLFLLGDTEKRSDKTLLGTKTKQHNKQCLQTREAATGEPRPHAAQTAPGDGHRRRARRGR